MPCETLLLVDDDKLLRSMLREILEQEGYVVVEATSSKRALEILHQHQVNMILLDLMLTDGNSLSRMEDIRECTDAPLMVISGSDERGSRIQSFAHGADDFVSKPLDFVELLGRIKAHLRRYHPAPSHDHEKNPQDCKRVQFGNWILDRSQFQLYDRSNTPKDLTPREFQLLEALVLNPERALKREELCQAIREERYVPTPRAIDVKITRIRKKIGDSATNPELIKTVRGIGYMLNSKTHAAD